MKKREACSKKEVKGRVPQSMRTKRTSSTLKTHPMSMSNWWLSRPTLSKRKWTTSRHLLWAISATLRLRKLRTRGNLWLSVMLPNKITHKMNLWTQQQNFLQWRKALMWQEEPVTWQQQQLQAQARKTSLPLINPKSKQVLF